MTRVKGNGNLSDLIEDFINSLDVSPSSMRTYREGLKKLSQLAQR
jgi:hypothetical protein